jgi:hypothetical protein
MPKQVLLDNDVALKVASYSLVNETLAVSTVCGAPPGLLSVARFVMRKRLARASNLQDIDRAKAALEAMLNAVELLEPTDDEIAMAAELENEARKNGLDLDVGESQLLAILARRDCQVLITGDKRAIAAISKVAIGWARERLACLEQLLAAMIETAGIGAIRQRVCSEPQVDRAITACFACASDNAGKDDVASGLLSYIKHLERSAPGVLVQTLAAERSG